MTKTLNIGILSTARINRRLIPPMQKAGRCAVVAVASRSAERAGEFARQWDIPHTFDSYEALLASPEIEAVYIPLPNSLHHDWTIKAAQAGKHILCEKPMGLTVAEVDQMVAAAKENGVVLQESFQYHMHPQLLKLNALIAEGLIGQVHLIRARFAFTLAEGSGNIRLDKALGGGSLWDVGSYATSFALSVAGARPIAVQAWQETNASGADTVFAGQIRFANGIIAQFDSSFRTTYRIGAEVAGEKGIIYVDNPWQPDVDGRSSGLRHIDANDETNLIKTEVIDPYLCSVLSFEAAVLDGKDPLYTLDQTRTNIAVINALYQSAETGQVVELD